MKTRGDVWIWLRSCFFHPLADLACAWSDYWLWIAIVIPGIISIITLFWFTIGGVIGMKAFFVALRSLKRNARDDGRVVGHHNLADEPVTGVGPGTIPIPAEGAELKPSPVPVTR